MNKTIRQAITKIFRKHTTAPANYSLTGHSFQTVPLPLSAEEQADQAFVRLKQLSHCYLIRSRGDAADLYERLNASQRFDRKAETVNLLDALQKALQRPTPGPRSAWILELADLRVELPQSFFLDYINNQLYWQATLRDKFTPPKEAAPRSLIARASVVGTGYPRMLELTLKASEGALKMDSTFSFTEPSQQLAENSTLIEQIRWRDQRTTACAAKTEQFLQKWLTKGALFKKKDLDQQNIQCAQDAADRLIRSLSERERALLKQHLHFFTDKL